MQEMSKEYLDQFEGMNDVDTFFTPAEKSFLLYSCIIGISPKMVSLITLRAHICSMLLFCAGNQLQ